MPLIRADYRDLPSHSGPEPFDAVVCLSWSILHVSDEGELLRALRSMRRVLRSGGVLVLTQGTTDRQLRERPRFILARNDDHVSRLFVIDYLGAHSARYHVLDIFHGPDRHDLQVWSTTYEHIWLAADYVRLLPEAGFSDAYAYGGYDARPYDRDTSQRLIVVFLA